MIIQCPKCLKKYKIDGEKVTEKGVKVTCQKCSNVMVVRKKGDAEGEKTPPPQEDKKISVPCIVCGLEATEGLDTTNPMCKGCADAESNRNADGGFFDFDPVHQKKEIDLGTSAKDFSFDQLSGGDFSSSAYSTKMLPENPETFAPMRTTKGDPLDNSGVNFDAIKNAPPAAPQAPGQRPPTQPTPPPGQQRRPVGPTPPPGQRPPTSPTPPPQGARSPTPGPMRPGTPVPTRPGTPVPARPGDDKKPK